MSTCFPYFPSHLHQSAPFRYHYRHVQQQQQETLHAPGHVQQQQKKETGTLLIRWNLPPPGKLKLNTDGSSLGNPGSASYGGLIRDNSGRWICGYVGKIGRTTSLEAEVCGICSGLLLLQQRGWSNVIVETDCQAALMLITVSGEASDDHPLKSLIHRCRDLMRKTSSFMIHTKREGNRCADAMAKLGHKLAHESCILELKPPSLVVPFLLADAAGVQHEKSIR